MYKIYQGDCPRWGTKVKVWFIVAPNYSIGPNWKLNYCHWCYKLDKAIDWAYASAEGNLTKLRAI